MIEEQGKEIDEMQNEFQQASSLMNDKHNQLNDRFLEL